MSVLRPLVRPAPTRLLLAAMVGALVAVAALAGSMASSAASGNNNGLAASLASSAPTRSASSQCASIERFHLDKQMNQRAADILAACGRYSSRAPDTRATFSALARLSSSPNDYGGTDVNIDHRRRGRLPEGDPVRGPGLGPGEHRRRPLQRLADVAGLLLGRLLLDERRRDLYEPQHAAVLLARQRHRGRGADLRRPGRLLRHRALEVGRDVPRLRLRSPGDRRLVLDRRHHLDGRPLRPLRRPATTASRAGSTTTRPAPTTATSTRAGTTSRSAAARSSSPSRPTAASPGALPSS